MNGFAIGFLGLVVTGFIGFLMFVFPEYGRYQDRLNAQNQVLVTEINIKNQAQLIEIEIKKAEIRVQEAKGIATSQKIIDSSLTTNYLQYLAIGAQKEMAHSPNHTQIYIPSGANGIPLIKTINAKE